VPPKVKVKPTFNSSGGSTRKKGLPDRTGTTCPATNHNSESTSTAKKSVNDHLARTDKRGPAAHNETLGATGGGGFSRGTTSVRNLKAGTMLVRYYGGGAKAMGSWWAYGATAGDPRRDLALPRGNNASRMCKGRVKKDVKVLEGAGAPRCTNKPGGPTQVCFPYPAGDHIEIVPGC
jgi:hypothetical protein